MGWLDEILICKLTCVVQEASDVDSLYNNAVNTTFQKKQDAFISFGVINTEIQIIVLELAISWETFTKTICQNEE